MGQRCVIFDIDGTLADCTHRLHFVKHGKRDWDGFFAAMGAGGIVEPVRELLWAVARGDFPIVICSGRPERYRDVMQNWLGRNGIGYDALYMRPDGDFRADHIVKKQILDGMRADGFEPFLVIDDRQRVVDMWREDGLVCLQAAPERPEIPETAILSLMVGPSGGGKSTWLGSDAFCMHGNGDVLLTEGLEAALKAAAPLIIEDCAKAVDYSLCDVAEDAELFGAHRDFFAATVRALKDA